MRVLWGAVFLLIPAVANAQSLSIPEAFWTQPRDSRRVARLPGLSLLLAAFERQPNGRLVIHHGSGEAPTVRAGELRAWLVSLGLPSKRVLVERNLTIGGALKLEVRTAGISP